MAFRQWWMTAVLLLASVGAHAARIQANSPALAVVTGNGDDAGGAFLALSVTGTGFGAAPSGLRLHVDGMQSTQRVAYDLASTDQRIAVWTDVQIVAKLPADLTRARATVLGPTGRSPRLAVSYFTHESYDTTAAAGPNGPPTHIAIDLTGRVWVNPEFKRNYYYYDPASDAVVPAPYPAPMAPPPFQVFLGANWVPSMSPIGGEGIVIDDRGRIWLPESGPAVGPPRDHGRIVMYDPPNSQIRVYDLPGDLNGFLGITWDVGRRRVWVSQTNSVAYGIGSALVSFDPERVPFETFSWTPGVQAQTVQSTFAFATTATCDTDGSDQYGACSNAPTHACQSVEDCVRADLICPPGTVDDSGCFHEYPVGVYQPAHMAVHPDGHVWFAEYAAGVGGAIGRLDPSSGAVEHFPLAPAPYSPRGRIPLGLFGYVLVAPWDIQVAPDGSIVATEYAANRIARFSFRSMRDTTQCHQLSAPGVDPSACQASYDPSTASISLQDPRCVNPCIQEMLVPGMWVSNGSNPPITHLSEGRLLTIAFDRQRNIWFDQGYLDRHDKFHLWPPLLAMTATPTESGLASTAFSGIGGGVAVDPRSGEIWGADYVGRRLNRLHPEP
jgi:streptogramin lyase